LQQLPVSKTLMQLDIFSPSLPVAQLQSAPDTTSMFLSMEAIITKRTSGSERDAPSSAPHSDGLPWLCMQLMSI
jgi:hypothetical protein